MNRREFFTGAALLAASVVITLGASAVQHAGRSECVCPKIGAFKYRSPGATALELERRITVGDFVEGTCEQCGGRSILMSGKTLRPEHFEPIGSGTVTVIDEPQGAFNVKPRQIDALIIEND